MGLRNRNDLTGERVFFITTTVVDFAEVFTKDKYCEILIRNIEYYQSKYRFHIYGYVIMPSHLHWIIKVNQRFGSISDIMRDIKKYSAWDVMEALEKDREDRFLNIFVSEANRYKFQKRKFWMRRFHDEEIINAGMFKTKLEYIYNNPVKAGLVENPVDYKFSSARNYLLDDYSVMKVELVY